MASIRIKSPDHRQRRKAQRAIKNLEASRRALQSGAALPGPLLTWLRSRASLELVLADTDAPAPTGFDVLRREGLEPPPAEALDDEALHDWLWRALRALGRGRIFLDCTDHLSDRALYEALHAELLPGEYRVLNHPLGAVTVALLVPGDPEHDAIYLKYYADEEARLGWPFHGEVPPAEPLPFDRDRWLPTPEDPPGRAERKVQAGRAAEADWSHSRT